MQKMLLFKILAILGLTGLICMPLSMIEHTIQERSEFRSEAVASIAADSVREQTLIGPILILPYTDDYSETRTGTDGKTEVVSQSVQRQKFIFPNELRVEGKIDLDKRYRGIHQVLVYSGEHKIDGDFVLPVADDLPRANATSKLRFGKPRIALGIEDVRGIRNVPDVDVDGVKVRFEQGSGLGALPTGLHAKLTPFALTEAATIKFAFRLGLDGIERQHFVPVGNNNTVTIASPWPHPQFSGRFLPSPRTRTIGPDGFKATWAISSLSTSAQQQILERESAAAKEAGYGGIDRFSVGFIEPVNVYSLAERATKYGVLFVALTFAAFFMFEILKRLPIHPVQYLLVGLALALFFLLLVSLSEHIAFAQAYLAAGAACIALLGFYLSYVLRDWRRGVGFATGLTMLYGALYGLLMSENNALAMGSLLLFVLLAAVMVATRKVDWYQIGRADPVPETA